MIQDITVIGAGGFGRETLDVLVAVEDATPGSLRILGVVDSSPSREARETLRERGVEFLGSIDEWLATSPTSRFIVAIGSPSARARVAAQIEARNLSPITVVHPAATIGTQSIIGEGSVVCAGAQVSTRVLMGRHVHVNPNATVGHDAHLGDYVSVNPAAVISGAVDVGPRTLLGAGSVVLAGLRVGPDSVVGAAACVTRDVMDGTTVVGVPARLHERSTT